MENNLLIEILNEIKCIKEELQTIRGSLELQSRIIKTEIATDLIHSLDGYCSLESQA